MEERERGHELPWIDHELSGNFYSWCNSWTIRGDSWPFIFRWFCMAKWADGPLFISPGFQPWVKWRCHNVESALEGQHNNVVALLQSASPCVCMRYPGLKPWANECRAFSPLSAFVCSWPFILCDLFVPREPRLLMVINVRLMMINV